MFNQKVKELSGFHLLVYCLKVLGHQFFLGHFLKLFRWIRNKHVILYVGIFF
jgi:hypothetical protein